MLPSECQIIELSGERVSVYAKHSSDVQLLKAINFETQQRTDEKWLDALSGCIDDLALHPSLPSIVVLASRLLLLKAIKVPVSKGTNVRDLLEFEVEQLLPHESEELLWSYQHISGDELEQLFLIFAIRQRTFTALQSIFNNKTVFLPSFSIQVASFLNSIADRTLEKETDELSLLMSIDDNHLVSLCFGSTEGSVRTGRIRKGSEEIPSELLSNMRKSKTAIRRQFGKSQPSFVGIDCREGEWSNVVSCVASTFEDAGNLQPFRLPSFLDWAGEGVIRPSVVFEVQTETEQSTSGFPWKILIGSLLIACAPWVWVVKSYQLAGEYKAFSNEARVTNHESEASFTAYKAELDSVKLLMGDVETHIRSEKTKLAWLRMFEDLQKAQLNVNDIWFESFDVNLNDNTQSPAAELSVTGRFLVRKSNLSDTHRQEAIHDSETSLQFLQNELLKSDLVKGIVSFKVNYEGLDRGVNVIPFSIVVELDKPFAANEREGEAS